MAVTADHRRTTGEAKPFRDRWQDRFQLEVGISWTLVPRRGNTWREWLFDPSCGLTVVGQKFLPMTNGRAQLPDGFDLHTMADTVDDGKGIDPATGLKNWWFVSRVFWLRGAVRVMGLDIGAGVYWRRKFHKLPAASDPCDSGRHAQRGNPSGVTSEGCQSGDAEGDASPNPLINQETPHAR